MAASSLAPSPRSSRVWPALHWLQPWAVRDPGELVRRYAALFEQRGGQILQGDAATLRQTAAGWSVQTGAGPVEAAQAVLALGPWSDGSLRAGLPAAAVPSSAATTSITARPSRSASPCSTPSAGYVLAPMQRGLRLTTGAESAPIDAPPTPVQLALG